MPDGQIFKVLYVFTRHTIRTDFILVPHHPRPLIVEFPCMRCKSCNSHSRTEPYLFLRAQDVQGRCCHAQALRLVAQRDPDPEGRRIRQTSANSRP